MDHTGGEWERVLESFEQTGYMVKVETGPLRRWTPLPIDHSYRDPRTQGIEYWDNVHLEEKDSLERMFRVDGQASERPSRGTVGFQRDWSPKSRQSRTGPMEDQRRVKRRTYPTPYTVNIGLCLRMFTEREVRRRTISK